MVNLEKQKYSPKLLNSFNHAVTEEGAILENLMAQGKAKPSDYYNFVDKSLGKLDEAWFDYKGSLPLGTKVNSNEAKLYSSLKENFYKFVTNAEMFGEAGAKRAQMKQIRAEFMNAEKEFKSLFQKGKNPLDLKKMSSLKTVGMGQGNAYIAEQLPQAAQQYAQVMKNYIPRISEVFPEIGKESLDLVSQKAESFLKNIDDLYAVNNIRTSNWFKAVDNAAKKSEGHGGGPHVPLKSRIMAMSHDIVTGNYGTAAYQAKSIVFDNLLSKMISSFGSKTPKTAEELLINKTKLINGIAQKNNHTQSKVKEVAKKILSTSKTTIDKAPKGGLIGETSYTLMNFEEKNHKIEKDYEKVVASLNYTYKNIDYAVNKVNEDMAGLDHLAPSISQIIKGNILEKIGFLANNLPKEMPAMITNQTVTTYQKSIFLDKFKAVTQPDQMLEAISNSQITPD